MERYGFPVSSQNSEVHNKMIATNIVKYGVPYTMQDQDISEKSKKKSYLSKDYKLPSGKVIQVQGYEPWALDLLLKSYSENDIETKHSQMPEFWYHGDDSKYHRYYSDIYIKKENLIIEVKSVYTYNLELRNNIIKKKTVEYNGYNFKFMIFDEKKNLISN